MIQRVEQASNGDYRIYNVAANGVRYDMGPAPEYPMTLNVSITGGDGMDPPGIVNDGIDTLNVIATFMDAQGRIVPVNKVWRVNIRANGGGIFTIVKLKFVNGVAQMKYATRLAPNVCHIDPKDLYVRFQLAPGAKEVFYIVPQGNLEFKVYEA